MRMERLDNYYFISASTPLLESGIHKVQTGMDFTMVEAKELVVKMGEPKCRINIGFNSKTNRHIETLDTAYNLLKHIIKTGSSKYEINKFFEPTGYTLTADIPNVELLENVSKLEFNKLFMAGTGRARNSVIKLYNIAMKYVEYKIEQIGGDKPKKKIYGIEQTEISLDMSGFDVEETLQYISGEIMDDEIIAGLIDYIEICLTQKPKTKIETYVVYRGDIGDKRLSELLRFSEANITINSKGTLQLDKSLHEQLPHIYMEGEESKDTHIILNEATVPTTEQCKAFKWFRNSTSVERLYNALEKAPLLDELPTVDFFEDETAYCTDFDENSPEFMYEDTMRLGRSVDVERHISPYKDLFNDVSFLNIRGVLENAISNGYTDKFVVMQNNITTVKDLIKRDPRIKNIDCSGIRELVIGLELPELLKTLNEIAENTSKVNQKIQTMIVGLNSTLEMNGVSSIEEVVKKKQAAMSYKVGAVGEGISLPLICSDKEREEIENEFLGLASPGCSDGILFNNIRQSQITPIELWSLDEEIIDGVTIPKELLQHLIKSTKQVVENVLDMTIATNRKEFITSYMNITETDDSETLTHKLNEAYQTVF